MARVDAAADGKILRFVDAAHEATFGAHPDAAASLSFDDASNAALVADLRHSTDAYTLSGGVLRKNAQAQTVAADSTDKQERDDFDSQLTLALTRLGAIKTAADAGFANVQQRDGAISDLALILRRTLRLVAQTRRKL